MWSKSPLLALRVQAGRVRFLLVLAGYAATGFLLSWEPLLRFAPGAWGEKLRAGTDAALAALWAVEDCEPQCFLHVDTGEKGRRTVVDLRTLGAFPGK